MIVPLIHYFDSALFSDDVCEYMPNYCLCFQGGKNMFTVSVRFVVMATRLILAQLGPMLPSNRCVMREERGVCVGGGGGGGLPKRKFFKKNYPEKNLISE